MLEVAISKCLGVFAEPARWFNKATMMTAFAQRYDKSMLYPSLPTLSVCPFTRMTELVRRADLMIAAASVSGRSDARLTSARIKSTSHKKSRRASCLSFLSRRGYLILHSWRYLNIGNSFWHSHRFAVAIFTKNAMINSDIRSCDCPQPDMRAHADP